MTHEHIDVNHIAALCRIELTPEEQKIIPQQIDAMLAYLQQLKEVNVDGIEPTLHATDLRDVLREDIPGNNFPVNDVLRNAPDKRNNQIVVPRIVE